MMILRLQLQGAESKLTHFEFSRYFHTQLFRLFRFGATLNKHTYYKICLNCFDTERILADAPRIINLYFSLF